MAYNNTISILIQARDEASAVLDKATSSLKSTADSVNAVGDRLTSVGSSLTKGITLPVAALGIATAKMAMDFQQKMEMLHTNAGIAQNAIAGLSNSVLNMAGQVGQSPEALATAFYHVASAGTGIWNTAQQLDILKVSAEGAAIGQANLDDTTYALTSALASNVSGAKSAAEMMATLNAIVGAGDMKLQDLNGAISTGFLSTAATFGISIQSVGTALATLTDNGEHADEAATRLRMTWALMASPSSVAAKQLSALGLTAESAKQATEGMNAVFAKSGLTTTKLADDLRQPNGMTVALEDLQAHLKASGMSASETDAVLSKAFGGGRTDAALLTMLQNIDRMNEKYKVINKTASDFATNLQDQQQTASQKVRNAWAGIQADAVRLGSVALPVLATAFAHISSAVTTVVNWYEKLAPWQRSVINDLVVLAATVGPVLLILGKFASALGAIIEVGPAVIAFFGRMGVAAVAGGNLMLGAIASARAGMMALTSMITAPMVMGAIGVAGALADIGLVAGAIQSVRDAMDSINNRNTAIQNAATSNQAVIKELIPLTLSNDPTQRNKAYNTLHQLKVPGYALGTNFAQGGQTLVGERGPELVNLPSGSRVTPASQTAQMMGAGKTIHIENMNVNNNIDVRQVIRTLGWKLATA